MIIHDESYLPSDTSSTYRIMIKQAVAELGHTRVLSCQLGQCSDQVERDRIGMVLVIKRNFSKVYVKYL